MPRVCQQNRLRLCFATALIALAVAACDLHRTGDRPPAIPISTQAAPPLATSSDWPAWRGGSLGGVVTEMALPVEWDQQHGVSWSVPVAAGRSSPIVIGDKIILTSEVPSKQGSDCVLHCFDRHVGSLLWSSELGVVQGPTHRKNGHASATPATDGRVVVTSLPPLGIFCHDLDGTLLWQATLGDLSQKWGFASSPLIHNGHAIQLADSEHDSFLTSFALQTGEIEWQTPRDSQGCWSTPVIAEVAGSELLIINGTGKTDGSKGEIIAYDPATGQVLWRVAGTTDIPCPTPLVADDLIISTSGGNGPILALQAGPQPSDEDRVTWKHAAGGPYVPTGVIYQEWLFVISDGGVLTCYQTTTGEKLYRKRLHGTFSASLVAGDGKLYAISEQGDCYVIRADDEYALLSTNRMRDRCLATPALAYGQIFLRTESTLYCIGGDSGESEPNRDAAPGPILPSPSDTLQRDMIDDAAGFISVADDEAA